MHVVYEGYITSLIIYVNYMYCTTYPDRVGMLEKYVVKHWQLFYQLIQHCWIQHCSTVCHTRSSNNFCLIKCWMKFDFHQTYCPTNMFDQQMLDSLAKASTKLHRVKRPTRLLRSPITYRQLFT